MSKSIFGHGQTASLHEAGEGSTAEAESAFSKGVLSIAATAVPWSHVSHANTQKTSKSMLSKWFQAQCRSA